MADSIVMRGGTLTIADGGQLVHNSLGVQATVQKSIEGMGIAEDGFWYTIASPVDSQEITGMTALLSGTYDFYRYKETDML